MPRRTQYEMLMADPLSHFDARFTRARGEHERSQTLVKLLAMQLAAYKTSSDTGDVKTPFNAKKLKIPAYTH